MANKKAAQRPTASTPVPARGAARQPAAARSGRGAAPRASSVDLKSLDAAWNESRVKSPSGPGGGPPDIPDGDYIAQVQSAKVGQYRSGNRKGLWFFAINYTITQGEHAGVRISSRDDLDKDREISDGRTSLDLFRERLQYMGIDVTNMRASEFPDLAKALGDPKHELGRLTLAVTVKNNYVESDKGQTLHFQNVYVREPVDTAG